MCLQLLKAPCYYEEVVLSSVIWLKLRVFFPGRLGGQLFVLAAGVASYSAVCYIKILPALLPVPRNLI